MIKKHIHFIGICGVAMSALAIMMQKKGWKVTGSDKGFYPPISTHLLKNKIEFYPGWHPEKIGKNCHSESTEGIPLELDSESFKENDSDKKDPDFHQDDNVPDLVVVGNVAGSTNPEFLFVKENNIPYLSYPELIKQELLKENNIIVVGTYGKTSCTTMLSWILKQADFKPSYMFGGLSLNLDNASDDLGGDWSVLEGDEYKTSRWDTKAKFFSYQPTHLLLTAVKWDHADVYPTEELYFEAFKKLVKMIPKDGLIIVSENIGKEILKQVQDDSVRDPSVPQDDNGVMQNSIKIVSYGKSPDCDYQYSDVKSTTTGLELKIKHKEKTYKIKTPILGNFQAENTCGSFAMAHQIGISGQLIGQLIGQFKGIKRRLEIRGKTKNNTTVIDDIAHSPDKVKSVLETLSNIYKFSSESQKILNQVQDDKKPKITCIFEPNTGNRKNESIPSYNHAFKKADEVIIPRLTKVKIKNEDPNPPFDGKKLTKVISKTHSNTKYVDDDEKLIDYLKENHNQNDVIVFCGSHSFRNMINELIK